MKPNYNSTLKNLLVCFLIACFGLMNTVELKAQTITYSEAYTSGNSYCPGDPQYDNWGAFRAQLDTSLYVFTKVTIKGSLDTVGRTCSDTVAINEMATALRNGVPATWTLCNGNNWAVGTTCNTSCTVIGDDVEFNADGSSCSCNTPAYSVRPCIGNSNWGGLNGACGGATQTMTVIFEYVACGLYTTTAATSPTCKGGTDGAVTLTPVDGTAPYTYLWSTTATTKDISGLAAGTYTVAIIDSLGCTYLDTAIVPDPTFAVSICPGGSVQLSADSMMCFGAGPYTYAWTPTANLSCATCENPVASPTINTVYEVVVTDGSAAVDSVEISITILPPVPAVNAGNDASYCVGDTTTLAGSGAFTYAWFPSAGLSDTTIANPMAYPLVTTSYMLIGDNSCGVDTDTVVVNVNPLPVITSGDTAICPGDVLPLIASGGLTYNWSPGASLDDSTIATPMATPNATTVFTATATSDSGCFSMSTFTVTLDSLNQVVAMTDMDTICALDSAQLNASTCSDFADDFDPLDVALWTTIVNGTVGTGCGAVNGNSLHFDNGPTRIAETVDLNVLNGGTIEFWLTIGTGVSPCEAADAGEDVQLQYSINGGGAWIAINTYLTPSYPSFTLITETIPVGAETATTRFRWTQPTFSNCNCDNWAIDEVSIPSCNGVDTTLVYSWSPTIGLSDPNIGNPMAGPDTTTTYVVSASNGICTTTDTITIFVDTNLSVTINSTSLEVCQGDSVTLSVLGTPGMPDTSSWTYLWSPTLGLSDTAAASPSAYPMSTTIYQLDVTNACGVFTDTITLTSKTAPAVSAGADVAFCSGGSVQLTGTGGPSYLWGPNQFLSCLACDKTNANPPSDMTYYVTVTDTFGCSATDSVLVEVNGQPIQAISTKPFVCSPGDTTQLFVLSNCGGGGGGATITYSETFTTGASYCPGDPQYDNWGAFRVQLDTNLYNFTSVTINGSLDNVGRTCTDPIMVQQMAGSLKDGIGGNWPLCDGNTWNVGTGCGSGCVITTDRIEFNAGGTSCQCSNPGYILRPCIGNDNWGGIAGLTCGATTQVMSVTFELSPCDTIIDSTVVFSWTPGGTLSDSTIINPIASPTTVMTYVVTADDQGCFSSDTITISVDSTSIAMTVDTTICFGDSVLIGVASNTTVSSYLWSPSAGLDDTSAQIPYAGPTSTTMYTVDVTNISGCVYSDSVEVTVVIIPIAGFSATSVDLLTTFTNSSVSGTSYFWDFGDGFQATVSDPMHTYNANGTYNVCLIANNMCGTDTFCSNVTVALGGCFNTVAAFDTIIVGQTAVFTDLSTDVITWAWDFGDGGNSTLQNPVYTYSTGGTYNVCLITTNQCSSDTICMMVTIATSAPPCTPTVGGFTSNSVGLTAVFNDASSDATSWSWDFGDGNTSTAANPVHIYGADSTYTVCLVVTNACSSDSMCMPVTVSASSCNPATAAFTTSPSGLTVGFNDTSTDPTAWAWDFGDGNVSTMQNPSNTYPSAGTYTVCLIVTNPCSADTICSNVTVTACPIPVASYTSSDNDLTVTFTDASTNGTSWSWDFDDGNISNMQNPMYTFNTAGTYNVCLTVSSGCATDIFCTSVTVTSCAAVIAVFSPTESLLDVTFSDFSANAGNWAWDFGDGNTSTAQNPSHTYAATGSYTVCLIASSACASDSTCMAVSVVAVGIEESGLGAGMDVFPNPTDGVLNVSVPLDTDKDMTFAVYNIVGEIVFEARASELNIVTSANGQVQYSIDLGYLADGSYLLKVQSGDKLFMEQVVFSK